jgi:hypothetical protein
VCLQPHDTICGLAVNPTIAPAKQSVPLSAGMPQEKGKLPPGWQPFLFPAPFRTSETNQDKDTERGLYNVCTNSASPDKVRKRKMPEMSMVVQVEAKKLKSNDTSTKPLKRTPIPRVKTQLEDPWSLTLLPKMQTQLKTQLITTYFAVKMGVGIVTVSRYLNEEANCLIGRFTCMAAFPCL